MLLNLNEKKISKNFSEWFRDFTLYMKVCLYGSEVVANDALSKIFSKVSINGSVVDKSLIRKLFRLCIVYGTKLNLPILKLNTNIKVGNKNNWIDNFEKKEIIENLDIYNLYLNSDVVSTKDKSKLESILCQSFMADLILFNYKSNQNYLSPNLEKKAKKAMLLNSQYSPIVEVENIIFRGHVFSNQMSIFLMLSSVFNYREIFDNLNYKAKLRCYEEFKNLNIVAKKALVSMLIKSRNEDAIFNLLRYGLQLNWEISLEDGVKNLVAFELLYSMPWVKAIIENVNLDLRLTNGNGENILHLLGNAIQETTIEDSLRRKINKLSHAERENLFFQLNHDGISPLMKAIVLQDEKLIEFMLSFNVKPWDRIDSAPNYKSAIEFLNENILNLKINDKYDTFVYSLGEKFWSGLAKKWNSEHHYVILQDELKRDNKLKRKVVKV